MKVVVIMPFAEEFNPIYTTIKRAINAMGPHWRCVRIDRDQAAGSVLTKIQDHIKTATICVADITNFNPNVMWEVGYANACDKPVIAIAQSTQQLPFDIHYLTTLKYQIEEQHHLEEQLMGALERTQRLVDAQNDRHVIAIAGSHTADRHQARTAFERIATPYLGRGVSWYCGARDPMQQEILGVLLDQEERIVVVNRQDRVIDSTLLKRLKRHGARILDPQDELAAQARQSAPNLLPGFDATFTLYAQRAQCVFLLWDGQSVKTRQFQEWLAAHGKTHLLARI